jgi:hypothetical protein
MLARVQYPTPPGASPPPPRGHLPHVIVPSTNVGH